MLFFQVLVKFGEEKMKKARKVVLGGLLTLLASAGSLGTSRFIEDGKKEREKIRAELPLRVIHDDDFWSARNLEEARRVYFQIMADYAENEHGYHRPGSAALMPRRLRDIEERLLWKFYNSEATRRAFSDADSVERAEFYKLFVEYGY